MRGTYGTYAAGDLLQVSVESGVVEYSRNGELLYTSTVAPAYPLLVDVALYTQATTLNSAMLIGNWTAPAHVPVAWTEPVGVTVNGNGLSKTATTGWGNAGAVSTMELASGGGAIQITASEITTRRMFGLGNGNTDANYTDLAFAWLLADTGELRVVEGGTVRGTYGTYAAGDLLQVSVESGSGEVHP